MVRIHVGEPLYSQSLTRICMQIVYLCEKKVCELIFLLNVHFSTRAWIPDLFSRGIVYESRFLLALPRLPYELKKCGISVCENAAYRWKIEAEMAPTPAYLEIVDFFASGTTPRSVIDFHPSAAMRERALLLLEKAKLGELTPEQDFELEYLTELEHILRMAKARARQILEAA